MNQRYSKVFALPENLYAQSAPVLIAAGQLLRDSATGGVVAQLKLMNLSDQTIIAAKVCLILQDIAGGVFWRENRRPCFQCQLPQLPGNGDGGGVRRPYRVAGSGNALGTAAPAGGFCCGGCGTAKAVSPGMRRKSGLPVPGGAGALALPLRQMESGRGLP